MPATVYSPIVSFQKKLLNLMYRRIDKFRKPVILLLETFMNNENYIYFLRNIMLQRPVFAGEATEKWIYFISFRSRAKISVLL